MSWNAIVIGNNIARSGVDTGAEPDDGSALFFKNSLLDVIAEFCEWGIERMEYRVTDGDFRPVDDILNPGPENG
jgi:hypothetical protein